MFNGPEWPAGNGDPAAKRIEVSWYRTDGTAVDIQVLNAVQEKGATTATGLGLTVDQAAKVVQSPVWDKAIAAVLAKPRRAAPATSRTRAAKKAELLAARTNPAPAPASALAQLFRQLSEVCRRGLTDEAPADVGGRFTSDGGPVAEEFGEGLLLVAPAPAVRLRRSGRRGHRDDEAGGGAAERGSVEVAEGLRPSWLQWLSGLVLVLCPSLHSPTIATSRGPSASASATASPHPANLGAFSASAPVKRRACSAASR